MVGIWLNDSQVNKWIKQMMKFKISERLYATEGGPIKKYTVPVGGVFVHNVLKTSGEPKPEGYGTFLEYWCDKAQRNAPKVCPALDPHRNNDGSKSDENEVVGAHVRIDDFTCPNDWAWIVPLCKHCNNDDRTWCIWIPEGTVLVPVKLSGPKETAWNEMDPHVKNYCWWFGEKE